MNKGLNTNQTFFNETFKSFSVAIDLYSGTRNVIFIYPIYKAHSSKIDFSLIYNKLDNENIFGNHITHNYHSYIFDISNYNLKYRHFDGFTYSFFVASGSSNVYKSNEINATIERVGSGNSLYYLLKIQGIKEAKYVNIGNKYLIDNIDFGVEQISFTYIGGKLIGIVSTDNAFPISNQKEAIAITYLDDRITISVIKNLTEITYHTTLIFDEDNNLRKLSKFSDVTLDSFDLSLTDSLTYIKDNFTNKYINVIQGLTTYEYRNEYGKHISISYSGRETVLTNYLNEQIKYIFENELIQTIYKDQVIQYCCFSNNKKIVNATYYDDPTKIGNILSSYTVYKGNEVIQEQIIGEYPFLAYQNRNGVVFEFDGTETVKKRYNKSGYENDIHSFLIYYKLDDYDDYFSHLSFDIKYYDSNNNEVACIKKTIIDRNDDMGFFKPLVISALVKGNYQYFEVIVEGEAWEGRAFLYIDAYEKQLANLYFYKPNTSNISGVLKERRYIEYYYDENGNLINTQNYQADYNSNLLPILMNDDFNTKSIFEYDNRGRITKNKIEGSNFLTEKNYSYSDDFLSETEDVDGLEKTKTYNSKFSLISSSQGYSGETIDTTSFAYGDRDYLSSINFNNLYTHYFQYNDDYNVSLINDYSYFYNEDDQTSNIKYYDIDLVSYRYDIDGFLTNKVYLNGEYEFVYDAHHNVERIVLNNESIHIFEYDPYFINRIIRADNTYFTYDIEGNLYVESRDNYLKTNIIDKKTNNVYQVYSHNDKKLISINNEFKYDSEKEDFLAVNFDAYSLLISNSSINNGLLINYNTNDVLEILHREVETHVDSNQIKYITNNNSGNPLHYSCQLGERYEVIIIFKIRSNFDVNIVSFESPTHKEYGVYYSNQQLILRETIHNTAHYDVNLNDNNYHILSLRFENSRFCLKLDDFETKFINVNLSFLLDKPNSLDIYAQVDTYNVFLLSNSHFTNDQYLKYKEIFDKRVGNINNTKFGNECYPNVIISSHNEISSGELIPFDKSFNSTNNKSPLSFLNMNEKYNDNFVFDKDILRYVYKGVGQTINYKLSTSQSKTIAISFKPNSNSGDKLLKYGTSLEIGFNSLNKIYIKNGLTISRAGVHSILLNQYNFLVLTCEKLANNRYTFVAYLNGISVATLTINPPLMAVLGLTSSNNTFIKDLCIFDELLSLNDIQNYNVQFNKQPRKVSFFNPLSLIQKDVIRNNSNIIIESNYDYKLNSDNATYSDKIETITKNLIGGTSILESYEYDSLRRITSAMDCCSSSFEYLNERLSSATIDNIHYSYSYDNRGNITKKTINGQEINYTYNNVYKDRLESVGNTQYGYFENNPLYISTITRGSNIIHLNYTGKNLTSFIGNGKTISFEYDYQNKRTRKVVTTNSNITTYEYLYDFNGNLVKQIQATQNEMIETTFLRDSSGSLYGFIYNGDYYYYLKNLLGIIYGIIDSNGVPAVYYQYSPYGEVVSITGPMSSTIELINPYVYKDYYYDRETGLYWLSSRYYDPEIGRFISPDSVDYLDPTTINGLNLFAYCGNDPVNYVDPSGYAPQWWQWALLSVGAALVVASAVVLTVATCGVGTAAFCATMAGTMALDASIGCLVGVGLGTAVGLAGGAIYSGVTGADLGESMLKGFMIGFGGGAIVGAAFGAAYGALTFTPNPALGEITKLGKIATNQGGKITSYGIHGSQRMAERGVSKTMAKLTVRFGTSILQNNGKVAYLTQKAFVVLNSAGMIVTTYGSGNFDEGIQEIIRLIFGG